MLTILAGLEEVYPDLAAREVLTIHIIGATQEEAQIQMMNEELLHILPSLKRLVVGYIGPEFPSDIERSTGVVAI